MAAERHPSGACEVTHAVRDPMVVDVSVVIPTSRRERQVLAAVASALAQTGVGVEVVVVDDSPEGSARAPIATLTGRRLRNARE